MEWKDIARIRAPGFTVARRGYDRHEVDRFLGRLADWLETDAPSEIGQLAVTRKLELVGKSTAHILLTTEQESEQMLRRAQQESGELRDDAEAAAGETRRAADAYAREVREKADEDARRTTEAATATATKTVEAAEHRREEIDAVVGELTTRRDETLRDLERLQRELGATIAKHKGGPRSAKRKTVEGGEPADAPDGAAANAENEPKPARESAGAAG